MSITILALALAGIGLMLTGLADQPRRRAMVRLARLLPVNGSIDPTEVGTTNPLRTSIQRADLPTGVQAVQNWLAQRWSIDPGSIAMLLVVARIVIGVLAAGLIALLLIFFSRGAVSNWLAGILGIVTGIPAGLLAVRRYLKDQASRRQQIIAREMPNAMDLLLISLASGLSLESSLGRVAREMTQASPEVAAELTALSADLVVLGDYDKAFANLAERVPVGTVVDMSSLIRDSLKNGSPIRDALSIAIRMQRQRSIILIDQLASEIPAKITTVTMILCFPPLLLVMGGPPILGLVTALAE